MCKPEELSLNPHSLCKMSGMPASTSNQRCGSWRRQEGWCQPSSSFSERRCLKAKRNIQCLSPLTFTRTRRTSAYIPHTNARWTNKCAILIFSPIENRFLFSLFCWAVMPHTFHPNREVGGSPGEGTCLQAWMKSLEILSFPSAHCGTRVPVYTRVYTQGPHTDVLSHTMRF